MTSPMMTCKELAELLMDYCAGELPDEHCELIRQHILLCGPCQNYMDSYQITVRVSRNLPMAEMPQHLVDKLRLLLKDKEKGEETC